MKIFYLIQAHKNPSQLERLIERLNEPWVYFIIHIDLKVDLKIFTDKIKANNIIFIDNRVDCIWGDYSQVIATLNMIIYLENLNTNGNDRIILLSGQDYPLKSNEYIKKFFKRYSEFNFIDIDEKADKKSQLYKKILTYKINKSSERGDFIMVSRFYLKNIAKNFAKGKLKFSDLKYLFKPKTIPFNWSIYKGSNWCAFNYLTIEKITKYYESNKSLIDSFFQTINCPDELFFQTLFYEVYKHDKVIKLMPSVTYVNWKRKIPSLPVTFQKEDEAELFSQGENKLFARKFDMDLDNKILDILDERILSDFNKL